MSNKNIELLAPVGSMESLYAAVQNGADAVYLGGKVFSARQYANNFDYEELEEAVEYAHLRGVKVYVTANILMDDEELGQAIDYINFLYNIDVDGLIVQDMGLVFLVKELFPRFELHGSTQMTINNLEGALFLEKLGFTRVVLARETPIEEIRRIKENSKIELEGFIHGALCVAYSGQCLMSSLIGGRSGNRGSCAQPCRKKYRIVDTLSKKPLKNFEAAYVLSSRDLNTIDHIDEIVDSGIVSLKIEGRMKKPEYVATVVSKYRKLLDQDSISDKDKRELKEIFNREFTKGIGLKDFGPDFLSYEKPNNKGLLVGKVDSFDRDNIYINLSEKLNPKDTLKIVTDRGKDFIVHWNSSDNRGDIVKIDNIRGISKGREVYRTSNSQLLERARESYGVENKNYPIDLRLKLKLGEKPSIKTLVDGEEIEVITDFTIEEAKKAGLDREKVREQLDKLGDTVYYLRQVDIDMDENIFMPVRELNELRRAIVHEVDRRRADFNKRSFIKKSQADFKHQEKLEIKRGKGLSIYARSYDIFSRLDLDKLDRLYIGFTDRLDQVFERIPNGIQVFLWTDKILYEQDLKEIGEILRIYEDRLDGVFVNNLGSLAYFKDKFDLKLHGGDGLNVFNDYASQFFKLSGLDSISLSPELKLAQIQKIADKDHNIYEVLGYGYVPVMINEACPMSIIKKCNYEHDCRNCAYNKGYSLVDEMKAEFYFERVKDKTKIYNSVPIMTLDFVDRLYSSGVDLIRLDFNFESEEIEDIQKYFYDYINGYISKEEMDEYFKGFRERNSITKGHFYRGVM